MPSSRLSRVISDRTSSTPAASSPEKGSSRIKRVREFLTDGEIKVDAGSVASFGIDRGCLGVVPKSSDDSSS